MKMGVMTARCRPRIDRSGRAAFPAERGRSVPVGALALVPALLALPACGAGTAGGSQDGSLDVVASFYPMQFLAERIGGDHVSVTTLTEPGVEPHEAELSPRQVARLTEADVVVYLRGLQPAVDEAVEQADVAHVAEATAFTTLLEAGEEHEHGHAEEGGHGHEHADGLDPHLWLDPVRFADVARGVGDVMAEADPDHAAAYRRATDRLVAELTDLDEEFREGLADLDTRTFVTNHAAFGYLAHRYDLDEESVAGLDPESEPSGERLRELSDLARDNDVTTVFLEPSANDDTARTVADDLGLETAVLDPVESITEESPGEDYVEVMRANLDALRDALTAS